LSGAAGFDEKGIADVITGHCISLNFSASDRGRAFSEQARHDGDLPGAKTAPLQPTDKGM
jgi:hypothetical protein